MSNRSKEESEFDFPALRSSTPDQPAAHPQPVPDREANIAAALQGIGAATFAMSVSFIHRPARGPRLSTLSWHRAGKMPSDVVSKMRIDTAFKDGRCYFSPAIRPGWKKGQPEGSENLDARIVVWPIGRNGPTEAAIVLTGAPRLWRLNRRRKYQFENAISSIEFAVLGPRPQFLALEKQLADGTVLVTTLPLVPKPAVEMPGVPAPLQRLCRIAGCGAAHRFLTERIRCIAETNVDALIVGETGTGKELVAQEIHELSDRRRGPYIKVNVGALPETLIEPEMFGTVLGAGTGSVDRKGWFEAADGGTILLDEFFEAPPEFQVKVLRFLQERVLTRVGSTKEIKVDVRVIFATNRDPEKCVRQGKFREDLYYRVAGVRLDVPPLRDRREDIPEIVKALLPRIAKDLQSKDPRCAWIDPRAVALIASAAWPGNIRELQYFLRSLLVFCGPLLSFDAVKQGLHSRKSVLPEKATRADEEQDTEIDDACILSDGKVSLMAKHLGVTTNTVRNRIARRGKDPRQARNWNGSAGGNGDGPTRPGANGKGRETR